MRRAFPVYLVLLLLLPGCLTATYLPVPPHVLRDGSGSKQLATLQSEDQTADMKIFYVTDRRLERDGEEGLVFGHRRSRYVIYGSATVGLRPDASWNELVAYSGAEKPKARQYRMDLEYVTKSGEFQSATQRIAAKDGKAVLINEERALQEEAQSQIELSKQLRQVEQRDVYIYIHGFNNTFEDAILRTAGIWHYLGRRGIAISYSWPAGRGGLFGYFYDRESGEYTIYDLKRTLRVIAANPDVERVHVISHSRGTDVTTTALRELNLEYTAAGKDPQKELKLQTLVIAAPDMDEDVFAQRFGVERLVNVAEQVVLYTSVQDDAMSLAQWLFSSTWRMGQLDAAKLSPRTKAMLDGMPQVQVVQCQVKGFSTTHDYVFNNPAAFSDLVLVLRDGKKAGPQNGRPLGEINGIWQLENDYLKGK